jgi:hypothetical protein
MISYRGLAWHTDEQTLRAKFEEFGGVEEAVSYTRDKKNPCACILYKMLIISPLRSLSRIAIPAVAVDSVSFVSLMTTTLPRQ